MVGLALVLGGLQACTSGSEPPGRAVALPDAVTRTSVDTRGAVQAVVEEAPLTEDQRSGLEEWGGLTVSAGEPVEITLDEALPTEGVVLERTYAEPLPESAGATFAFWDEAIEAWHAVPSRLSADRRTLTATVDHLSVWTDVVGWLGGAVEKAADWASYQLGKIFDTRVDAPTCAGPEPEWVRDTVHIETARTNPVLFCTGHDRKRPDLLVVKARVNRGYGYAATIAPPTQWTYSSTLRDVDVDDLLRVVGKPGDAAFELLQAMTGGGTLVGPGEELSLGLAEADTWSSDSSTVLELSTPDLPEYLVWLLSQLVLSDLTLKADGIVAAVVGVSGCVSSLRRADSPQRALNATLECVSALDEQVAHQLAGVLQRRGVKDAGRVAGKVMGKLSVYLAVLAPTFGSMTYFADARLDAGARTVSVFGSNPPRVGARVLRRAEVPANCGLPAQRLVDGKTTQGSPGGGTIDLKGAQVDLAGLGYRQALTTYACSAGGVSWPETLVLIGADGVLLGSFDLGRIRQREHADVEAYRVDGDEVVVSWTSYEGAGYYVRSHRATVSYRDEALVVEDQLISYDDAAAFAEAVAEAAAVDDRSTLLDPAAVPEEYWDLLVGAIAGRDPIVMCDQVGEQHDCGISFEPDYEDEAYFFVSGQPGLWRVEYASTSVY